MAAPVVRGLVPLAWLAGLACAAWLWQARQQVGEELLGTVDAQPQPLATLSEGRLADLRIAIGDQVVAGQVVATLHGAELERERDRLAGELQRERELLAIDQRAAEAESLRLRLEHVERGSRLLDRAHQARAEHQAAIADLGSCQAELQALEREIARQGQAGAAGLGRADDLAELVIRADGLRELAAGRTTALAVLARWLADDEAAVAEHARCDLAALSVVPAPRRWERIAELEQLMAEIQVGLRACVIEAAGPGTVIALPARVGDALPAFAPVAMLLPAAADAVDAWLPESDARNPGNGSAVTVVPMSRPLGPVPGTVLFVHPGYGALPLELLTGRGVPWGRKLRIALPPGHGLLPGERVRVHLAAEPVGP